jgi:hypothetical protein
MKRASPASILTVTLSNGREVLARLHDWALVAFGYANRTQAKKKAIKLGAGWAVIHPGRPFFVSKAAPPNDFKSYIASKNLNPKDVSFASLPAIAFVEAEWEGPLHTIVIVRKEEKGYHANILSGSFDSPEQCRPMIDQFNAQSKVTPTQAEFMKLGALFGWSIFKP